MVREAERYKAEDDKQRERVTARNQLEAYVLNVKQALGDAGNKLSESEKNSCKEECENVLRWLDNNSLAEKEETDDKMQSIQKICSPVMSKLHGSGGGQQAGDAGARAGRSGPTVEEVD